MEMTDNWCTVEAVASALVREYLHGKGYQETLGCIDVEISRNCCPSEDAAIKSRTTLAKTLHIEKLLKKNKQEQKPYKTMLEVISKYFVTRSTKATMDRRKTKIVDIDNRNGLENPVRSEVIREIEAGLQMDLVMVIKDEASIPCVDGRSESRKQRNRNLIIRSPSVEITHSDQMKDEKPDNAVESFVAGDDGLNSNRMSPVCRRRLEITGDDSTSVDSKERMKSRQNSGQQERGDPGGLVPDNELPLIRRPAKSSTAQSRSSFLGGPISAGGLKNPKLKRNPQHPFRVETGWLGSSAVSDNGADVFGEAGVEEVVKVLSNEEITNEPGQHVSHTLCSDKESKSETMGNWLKTASLVQPLTTAAHPDVKLSETASCGDRFRHIEVSDLDALEESSSELMVSPDSTHVWLTLPHGNPIDSATAIDLKTLLFGNYKKDFSEEWKVQNFELNKNPFLSYGLVQKKGGPCGVLTCVQAYLLKNLLFGKSKGLAVKSDFSKEEVKKCLGLTLAHILWKVGNERTATVAFPSNRQSFSDERPGLCNGFIEKLSLMHFTDLAVLQSFLSRYVGWYTDDNRFSCIAFLYSVILSKGIESVRKDMDDPNTCLIGVHSYCSQEVVNLMLTGHASSNVFDNVVVLEEGTEAQSTFKGVTKRSDIGFLALFEHYNSCQVGQHLKCPRYPIWVVCSESHFSVLFSKDSAMVGGKFSEKPSKFDLYYCDGLLQQDREIRLTIDMTGERIPTKFFKDLVPPLELCIRTKWTGAVVDWNGTDPLL